MNAGQTSGSNVLQYAEDAIKAEIKATITNRIVEKLTSELKSEVEVIVRGVLDGLEVDYSTSFRDLFKMRDELHVYLHLNKSEDKEADALELKA